MMWTVGDVPSEWWLTPLVIPSIPIRLSLGYIAPLKYQICDILRGVLF